MHGTFGRPLTEQVSLCTRLYLYADLQGKRAACSTSTRTNQSRCETFHAKTYLLKKLFNNIAKPLCKPYPNNEPMREATERWLVAQFLTTVGHISSGRLGRLPRIRWRWRAPREASFTHIMEFQVGGWVNGNSEFWVHTS